MCLQYRPRGQRPTEGAPRQSSSFVLLPVRKLEMIRVFDFPFSTPSKAKGFGYLSYARPRSLPTSPLWLPWRPERNVNSLPIVVGGLSGPSVRDNRARV